jgi:hypothetical protein
LLALIRKAQGKFVADVDEIRPQYQDSTVDGSAVFQSSLVRDFGPSIGSTIDALDNLTVTEVGSLNELATPWYSDQVLPFDITMTARQRIWCASLRLGLFILPATKTPARGRGVVAVALPVSWFPVRSIFRSPHLLFPLPSSSQLTAGRLSWGNAWPVFVADCPSFLPGGRRFSGQGDAIRPDSTL